MAQLIIVASAAPKLTKSSDGHEWDSSITSIRGGKESKKPLGQYLVKPEMEFRSEYKNETTEKTVPICLYAQVHGIKRPRLASHAAK
jgi:hypothetical protein